MPFSCTQLLGKKVWLALALLGHNSRSRERRPLWPCPLAKSVYKSPPAASGAFHSTRRDTRSRADEMLRHLLRHENNKVFVLILLYCVLVSILKLCTAQADTSVAATDNGIGVYIF